MPLTSSRSRLAPARPALITPPGKTKGIIWSDEFDGVNGAALSGDWVNSVGRGTNGWGNNENQFYTAGTANVALNGSSCAAFVTRQGDAPDSPADSTLNYTAAQVTTRGKKKWNPTSGGGDGIRIWAKINVPWTRGLHTSFWTMGFGSNGFIWPNYGEIDILEVPVYANAFDGVYPMNLHGPTAAAPGTDLNRSVAAYKDARPLSGGFHTYGVDWYRDRVVWHFDTVAIGQYTQAQYEAAGGNWVQGFQGDHFLLLNVAIGGNWPGEPDGSTVLPKTMLCDWVRVEAL